MLHLLGGLLTPTSGRIIVDGEDLTAAPMPNARIFAKKNRICLSPFQSVPTLTAEGNLRLAERIHGNGGDIPDGAGKSCATGLEDKLHHKPLDYLGGEQQR